MSEIDEKREEILRDALEQYVANIGDLDLDDTTQADREKYDMASDMLDEMCHAFVARMGAL